MMVFDSSGGCTSFISKWNHITGMTKETQIWLSKKEPQEELPYRKK